MPQIALEARQGLRVFAHAAEVLHDDGMSVHAPQIG
jgi:hypothetical protein